MFKLADAGHITAKACVQGCNLEAIITTVQWLLMHWKTYMQEVLTYLKYCVKYCDYFFVSLCFCPLKKWWSEVQVHEHSGASPWCWKKMKDFNGLIVKLYYILKT